MDEWVRGNEKLATQMKNVAKKVGWGLATECLIHSVRHLGFVL